MFVYYTKIIIDRYISNYNVIVTGNNKALNLIYISYSNIDTVVAVFITAYYALIIMLTLTIVNCGNKLYNVIHLTYIV